MPKLINLPDSGETVEVKALSWEASERYLELEGQASEESDALGRARASRELQRFAITQALGEDAFVRHAGPQGSMADVNALFQAVIKRTFAPVTEEEAKN
jgi:hypothetical protein